MSLCCLKLNSLSENFGARAEPPSALRVRYPKGRASLWGCGGCRVVDPEAGMTKSAGTFWDCRESADSLPSDLLVRVAVRPLIAASPRPAATDSSGSLSDFQHLLLSGKVSRHALSEQAGSGAYRATTSHKKDYRPSQQAIAVD